MRNTYIQTSPDEEVYKQEQQQTRPKGYSDNPHDLQIKKYSYLKEKLTPLLGSSQEHEFYPLFDTHLGLVKASRRPPTMSSNLEAKIVVLGSQGKSTGFSAI